MLTHHAARDRLSTTLFSSKDAATRALHDLNASSTGKWVKRTAHSLQCSVNMTRESAESCFCHMHDTLRLEKERGAREASAEADTSDAVNKRRAAAGLGLGSLPSEKTHICPAAAWISEKEGVIAGLWELNVLDIHTHADAVLRPPAAAAAAYSAAEEAAALEDSVMLSTLTEAQLREVAARALASARSAQHAQRAPSLPSPHARRSQAASVSSDTHTLTQQVSTALSSNALLLSIISDSTLHSNGVGFATKLAGESLTRITPPPPLASLKVRALTPTPTVSAPPPITS